MEEDATLVSREQYIEMLIDDSFRDAVEMERGFMPWCQKRAPAWHEQGHDETWIRLRIESARTTQRVHRILKEQGLTMLEIRDALRETYIDYPQLYDLAVERERLHPGPLLYRGNTSDLRIRYTLRVMVYEADKLAYAKLCSCNGQPVPSNETAFFEQPDTIRVIRDLSTVEELELALTMCRYLFQLADASEKLTKDQICFLMEDYGKQLRATFIAKYGYPPEDSSTPYVPVTIDGPQDHEEYYAREYPQ